MVVGPLLACVLAAALAEPAAIEPLTTAREIAAHVSPEGDKPRPVRLEAVVTYQDLPSTIFLRDDTGATFIHAPTDTVRVAPGQRLLVVGTTHYGLFIGGIRADSVTLLDEGPPPEPRPITPLVMDAGSMHYEWVWLEGVGREIIPTGETTATLLLFCGDREVEVRFDHFPIDDPPSLVDARLRVAGLAAGNINDRRQIVLPYLRSCGMEDVTILEPPPAEPFDQPAVSFAEVGRQRAAGRRVRIEGVVTATDADGGIFLHDGKQGMFLQLAAAGTKDHGLQPGDRADAVGFPAMGPFAAFLDRSEVRPLGRGVLPDPVNLRVEKDIIGRDAEPVIADLDVVQREDADSRTVLLGRCGDLAIRVSAPAPLPDALAVGTRVWVRGVCRVTAATGRDYIARPTAYMILPATAADVTLLEGVPWWTRRRITLVLAAGLATAVVAGLIATSWAFLLKRQVKRQISVIENKLQDEAAVEERRRIAREFHDSLEQELAALTLRLDAGASGTADPEARQLLEHERSLAARLQAETRQFVWDLRDPARAHWTLEALLTEQIEEQQSVAPVPIRLTTAGGPVRVPPVARYHLLRIIREAVHNAVEHSGGTAVDVRLAEERGLVVATVADDGTGFDLATRELAIGHFGIRGMQERARRIGGRLAIESRPGHGTRVTVTVPDARADAAGGPAAAIGRSASVPRLGVSS